MNPTQELAKRIQANRKSLHIARIPDKTKEVFIQFAEEEFCGDYGMALKWLIDDKLNGDIRTMVKMLEDHESRIQVLESKEESPKPEESVRKMLDGKTRSIRGVTRK